MCTALVLVVASVSALNLALPDLAVSLQATNAQLTWIADSYTVALAALVLPIGALGDRWGRRSVLVAGTGVFAAAAAAAALTTDADTLIAWRALMGLGAAMIMPGTLSTITAVFPVAQRARAVATWSGFAAAGSIIGMLVAGSLLERWGWESIFVVTAAVAVVAGVLSALLAPDTREQIGEQTRGQTGAPEHRGGRRRGFDVTGALSTAVAVGALVFAIIEGNEAGWHEPEVLAAFAACALGLAVYLWAGLRRADPLLDPRLFTRAGFTHGATTVVVQFMAVFGFFFVGLQYLQLILDYSPLRSALAMAPVAVVILPASRVAPRLAARVGSRVVMVTGLALLATALFMASQLQVESGYGPFVAALAVAGLGMGLASSTATNAIVTSLPGNKQGVASAMNDTTREVGSAVGIALMGSVYSSHYTDALPALPAGLPAQAVQAVNDSAAAGLAVAAQSGPLAPALTAAVQGAFVDGLTAAMSTVGLIVLAAAAFITIDSARRSCRARRDRRDRHPVERQLHRPPLGCGVRPSARACSRTRPSESPTSSPNAGTPPTATSL
ncbi:MFS transporter [Quadrisphaera oryzae]|uniref:MFS transporter n=1 Tax=Quadrisphaera TaxID=317661 RepID=UPI00164455E8|nr:MFS transporter [Quadrisphaera sp. RL12-1S]MBC3761461.1 MFS transporter [Quadrisphaera sp. RL12-1S]